MKKARWIASGLAVLLLIGLAHAQFADGPQDAVEYRQSVMTLIVYHFKQMGRVIQGKADFDPARFVRDAEIVQTLSRLPWKACLVPGSDEGNTTMNAKVFTETERFTETAAAFEAAADGLVEAAGAGEMKPIAAAFGEVAGNCKSCHGTFRSR